MSDGHAFHVIPFTPRPQPPPTPPAPTLLQKVARLQEVRPRAVAVLEKLVDRWLRGTDHVRGGA
jgi:hypothetical protein